MATDSLYQQRVATCLTLMICVYFLYHSNCADKFPHLLNADQVTPEGRGPAWATSLLEDNAQFGMGIHFALKQRRSSYAAAVQDLLMRSEQGGSEQLRAAFEDWLQVGDQN